MSEQLTTTFDRTVDEGFVRLTRTWPALIATGTVGGIDLCLGVFGYYFVYSQTHSRLLGALVFSSGFVALVLAGSELFTENFLVPVAAVIAKDATVWQLLRLWATTLVTNLVAAWLMTGLIVAGFPGLRPAALQLGAHPGAFTVSWSTMANTVLAGATITLMTWMERATESVPAKIVVASTAGFLLLGGQLAHSIVDSVAMFGSLHVGSPYGYLRWLGFLGLAIGGNVLGGLALVTVLRLVQVGAGVIREEQRRDPDEPRNGEPVPEKERRAETALPAVPQARKQRASG